MADYSTILYKKSKYIFLLILLLLFVFISGIFSGTIAYAKTDETLYKYITENEIEQFRKYNENLHLKLLYNLDNEPEYILAYNKDGVGYEIYSRISRDLLESCSNAMCPYIDVEKGYYIGALNYATGSLDELVNLETKKRYSEGEKNKILQTQKRLKNKSKMSKKSKLLKDESIVVDFNNIGFSFNISSLNGFENVEHPGVIKNMKTSLAFGNNVAGSCCAVSANIIYQYIDVVYGGVVPYLPTTNWINTNNGQTIVGNNGNSCDLTLVLPDMRIMTQENMHKYLIKLSGATSLGLNSTEKENMFLAYSQEITSIGCLRLIATSELQETVSNVYSSARTNIKYLKMPIELSIYYTKTATASTTHSVVAYGVYHDTSANQYYFRVHAGHNNKSDCIINGDFLNSDGYLSSVVAIKNSQHVLTAVDNSFHTCSNLACYACNNEHRYFYKNNEKHKCACGFEENHDMISVSNDHSIVNVTYDSNITQYCRKCGYYA